MTALPNWYTRIYGKTRLTLQAIIKRKDMDIFVWIIENRDLFEIVPETLSFTASTI